MPDPGHGTKNWRVIIAPAGGSFCPDQAFSIRTRGGTGEFPVGEISRPQTTTVVVVK